MSIQEKNFEKNTEEKLARIAGIAASERALHLCRAVE